MSLPNAHKKKVYQISHYIMWSPHKHKMRVILYSQKQKGLWTARWVILVVLVNQR